jgi:hypothetical protein
VKLKYYWNLLKGKTNAINPAKLDLPHIWAVIQSWFRSLFPIPKHIKEQTVWRRLEVIKKSPTCWIAGACVQCGCLMPEKTMADMDCEYGCYPVMMNKKEWKVFKKNNGIRIFDLL